MAEACSYLHQLAQEKRRYRFPFDPADLPPNGVYLLFERGERAHGGDRIVRVGTHRGQGQLAGRLQEHFVNPNKDRSIFRKNIGRAVLTRADDSFLESWELDLTSRRNKDRYSGTVDADRQADVEAEVSAVIRESFSFVVLPSSDPAERLELERRLIGTVAGCAECRPSDEWLGQHSPKEKIRNSGLWQEQHLTAEPLTLRDVEQLLRPKGSRPPRVDEKGRAYAGSQRQVQTWVNEHAAKLAREVGDAIGPEVDGDLIEWKAPLKSEGYQEPLDQGFLKALGLAQHAEQLVGFWPSSGPRWDALGVVKGAGGAAGVLLVEAKSYPAEIEGSGMGATDPMSIRMISEALGWAKGVLGADRTADWTGRYYQYANRLAHVCFLRYQLGIPSWLVNLCFAGDPHRDTSPEEWEEALGQVKSSLGFSTGHIPHSVDIILPAKAL